MTDIHLHRREYEHHPLNKSDLNSDPRIQFDHWLKDALDAENILDPTAMTLATANQEGQPSARIVLLKDVNEDGFVFYTNYTSQKAQDLSSNNKAALLFWWPEFTRQIRVEGTVEKCNAATSDAYFASRSKSSNMGAHASQQSKVVKDRQALADRFHEVEAKFADSDTVPRPEFWGGYILKPTSYEFWSGRASRMHDRFSYTLNDSGSWIIERLAP